jgi:hypothetical protein
MSLPEPETGMQPKDGHELNHETTSVSDHGSEAVDNYNSDPVGD